ncbi:GAF domain-containing sensor histidine kinase, partial [Candidatus Bipolaricaulota bacterium]|nr:GAF domain-containing sensor histidine kinase [Candidatus Bipolaricaulota bacterium]
RTERQEDLVNQRKQTPELAALMGIAQDVASTLELKPLLGKILDKLGKVLEYDAASIMTLENDHLEVAAYRGPISQEKALNLEFILEEAGANREVIERKEPVLVSDVNSDEPLADEIRRTAEEKSGGSFGYLQSWLGVPLIYQDEVLGMMTLDHREPNHYSFRDAEVAMAFANQVGVAVENARLYEAEKDRRTASERRRQVAEGLRETMSVINSNESLERVLETILDQIYGLLGADSAAILRLEEESSHGDELVARLTTKNPPEEFKEVDRVEFSREDVDRDTLNRRSLVLEDLSEGDVEDYYTTLSMKQLGRAVQRNFGALISTPLVVGDELYGVIVLYYQEPRKFSDEEVGLATSFADQASLAIENARLNEKAEEAAVIEERNRMARELHDSVTQSLYSVTLFAEAAKRMADQGNTEQVRSHLENVERMSQQALKEMRLLIYQMRSPGKTSSRFEDKIKSRLETVERRSGVESSVEIKGSPDLSEEEVEELYLITQEALNNAQKHAEATRVDVLLESGENGTMLKITDDGCGFDPKEARECGGMGLSNMRERADKIGAELSIESEAGKGTTIYVRK